MKHIHLPLIFFILIIFSVCFVFSACSTPQASKNIAPEDEYQLSGTENGQSVRILTWNTQEFFDGYKDGCEYAEFQKSKNWSREDYETRLERLCEVLTLIDADIIILEEIENEKILQDITNFSWDKSWRKKDLWPYGTFTKAPGSAIGIAILSRYPLENVRTHSMDIRLYETDQPSSRPILEATAIIKNTCLLIFANHWKSKSGGQAETEIWRDWQETILANIVKERMDGKADQAVILCGDFNRDITDFSFNQKDCSSSHEANIILKSTGLPLQVYSPWLRSNNTIKKGPGSYRFKDQWERIDHIFTCGPIEISGFNPSTEGPWATEEGYPFSFSIYNGLGYSDHLPLTATIQISTSSSS